MKRLLPILVLALAACTTTDPLTVETNAMRSVTAARQVSTAALRAGKISLAADQKAQADLTVIATGIKAAVAANNPAGVSAQVAKADAIKTSMEAK